MSLAEVAVVDTDVDGSPRPLFVHCGRVAVSSVSKRLNESVHVQLLDAPTLYEAQVSSCHKPRALDCSGAEYVAAVETALSASVPHNSEPRFELKWSRQKRTLTLMERSEFAMKFCSIQFTVSEDVGTWRKLLHQVATKQRETAELISNKQSRMQQLETLLSQKEALLEAALTAKQKTEDKLVQGFCVVLNAKKDEIRRLQNEVERAEEMQKYEVKPAAKRKASTMKKTKKMGAKLKKKVEEEDEMSEGSSKESGDDTATENEEEESQQKRANNEALKAYSQLPTNLRSSSVHISSAENLLSSMDDIIMNEEEENDATQRGDNSQNAKSEPITLPGSRTRQSEVLKMPPTPPPKPQTVQPPRAVQPPVDEAMDFEEEDILDMLS